VEHSLSPYMHNAAFRRLKIKAAYLPLPVRRGRLKAAIASLKDAGISGFNITIPFKSECIRYLDAIEPVAKKIGAVNTVILKNNRLKGSNTDHQGFIRSLKEELRFDPRNKEILILGAGGAARAVAFGLANKGAKKIHIYDIIPGRASSLARNIKSCFRGCEASFCKAKDMPKVIKDCRLLVNCTPLGMKKKDKLPIDVKLLHNGLKVYDIVYTPLETRLIKAAKKKGITACGGVGMLLYQGAIAFEMWTRKKAPVSLMKRTLLDNIKR